MGIFDIFRKKSHSQETINQLQKEITANLYSPIIAELQKNAQERLGRKLTREEIINVFKERYEQEKELQNQGAMPSFAPPPSNETLEKIIEERKKLKEEREESLKGYPESRQFFEKVKEEAAVGVVASAAVAELVRNQDELKKQASSKWSEAVAFENRGKEFYKEGKLEQAKEEFTKALETLEETNKLYSQSKPTDSSLIYGLKDNRLEIESLIEKVQGELRAESLQKQYPNEPYSTHYVVYHGTVPEKIASIAKEGLKAFEEPGRQKPAIYGTTDPGVTRMHILEGGPHDKIPELSKTFSRKPVTLVVRIPKDWLKNQPDVAPEKLQAFEGMLKHEFSSKNDRGGLFGVQLPVDKIPPEFLFVLTDKGDAIPIKEFIAQSEKVQNVRGELPTEKTLESSTAVASTALSLPAIKPTPLQIIAKRAFQPIRCSTCGRVFNSEAEFNNEMMHSCVRVRIRCPVCGSEDVE